MAARALPLLDPEVPEGFLYRREFLTEQEQSALVAALDGVAFADFEMRGVIAKRRVAFFGETYDRASAAAIPAFLLPLRDALATWAQVSPATFGMALINEYRPGSPIGWHRDAPQYGIVGGVSLLASCRMKFRPYVRPGTSSPNHARRHATHEITLEPRSAYLMTGRARTHYEHHIPPVTTLRYSITFRTLR